MLNGRRVLLGVTGSIAAYQAVDLVGLLRAEMADVRVILTGAGRRFITPLSLEVVSGHPVTTRLAQAGTSTRQRTRATDLLRSRRHRHLASSRTKPRRSRRPRSPSAASGGGPGHERGMLHPRSWRTWSGCGGAASFIGRSTGRWRAGAGWGRLARLDIVARLAGV
jgi:hypothetical protein